MPNDRRVPRAISLWVFGLVVLGLLIAMVEIPEGLRLVGRLRPSWAAAAVAGTVASYALLAVTFVMAARLFGVRAPYAALAWSGLVGATLNQLVPTGGVAGQWLRAVVLYRHGPPVPTLVASGLFHTWASIAGLFGLLPIFAYISVNPPPGAAVDDRLFPAIVGLPFLLLAGLLWLTARPPIRRALLNRIAWLGRLAKREVGPGLHAFEAAIQTGVARVHARPAKSAGLFLLLALDWVVVAGVLWALYRALGVAVDFEVLFTALLVGTVAGLVSLVPGGLGIQDASMAGVLAWLGVPVTESVVGVILFRLTYYVFPFLVALVGSLPFIVGGPRQRLEGPAPDPFPGPAYNREPRSDGKERK